MLEFDNVSRSYESGGRQIVALKDVTLKVGVGEFVALVGRSGSGKSTLLNLACGIDRPTSGHIRIDNADLATMSDHQATLLRRRSFGIVFQFFNLIPTLTAIENVVLPAYLDGSSSDKANRRGRELIGQMGLAGREHDYPDRFSGGEQQRLAIARAIINDPEIILADEPTGNLDSETGNFILERLLDLSQNQGKTILMATHSPEAIAFTHRTIKILDGRIAE